MGDFEVFLSTMTIAMLSIIVYNLLTFLSFKDVLRRVGYMKNARRDFYECGFKPQNQRPVKYDIELVFLFPYASSYSFTGLYDILLLILFFGVLFVSLNVDYERHALY